MIEREYYASKFNNLDEMGKFLEIHKLPKFTQEETYLNQCNLPYWCAKEKPYDPP